MVQATTPTFVLTIADADLTEAEEIIFTLTFGCFTLTKTKADMTVTEHTLSVYLTQAETLQFSRGTTYGGYWERGGMRPTSQKSWAIHLNGKYREIRTEGFYL